MTVPDAATLAETVRRALTQTTHEVYDLDPETEQPRNHRRVPVSYLDRQALDALDALLAALEQAQAERDSLREQTRAQGGMAAKIERLEDGRDRLIVNLRAANARSRELAERLALSADDFTRGYDEGQEAIWDESVCSICGRNHDRDESAMCDDGVVVSFRQWVVWAGMRMSGNDELTAERDAALARIEQLEAELEQVHGIVEVYGSTDATRLVREARALAGGSGSER